MHMIKNVIIKEIFFFCIIISSLNIQAQSNQINKESLQKESPKNYFIENKGQIVDQDGNPNPNVAFLLNTPGLNVQLRPQGFSYDLYERIIIGDERVRNKKDQMSLIPFDTITTNRYKTKFHRIEFDFLNTNPQVKIISQDSTDHTFNYYNVIHQPEGITGVRSYKKITYENLYQNIDLEFFIPSDSSKTVEYNFLIRPNGKITDIKMQVKGASINYNKTHLEIKTEFGLLYEIIPMSWIENNGKKRDVNIYYQQLDCDIFSFQNVNQDVSKTSTIVIDPTPIRLWATYFGGLDEENGWSDMEIDNNGAIVLVGDTQSADNIATTGSFNDTYTSWIDEGYIAKFNPDGNLTWATYYGGLNRTHFLGVEVDSENKIIAVGYTLSFTNISTPGAHQTEVYDDPATTSINNDGFIVKFNESGFREWGTYYGGYDLEECWSVDTDNEQNIYVGGLTRSHENISSLGAFREDFIGPVIENGFLLKLKKDGNREWATYYAGNIYDVVVDNLGFPYFTGATGNSNDVTTTGVYQENLSDYQNTSDAMLIKFSPEGDRVWGTYYGGYNHDWGLGLEIDSENNIIMVGETLSTELIASPGAYQDTNNGQYDAFITKFNTSGNLTWSTYYGGSGIDLGRGVSIDRNDNIFLVGGTSSSDNISTTDSYQEIKNGNYDAYLSKFDKSGIRLWGTYYGGEGEFDEGSDVETNDSGDIFITGKTQSSSNIASVGSHQETYGGGEFDTFLVNFNDCFSAMSASVTTDLCEGEDIVLSASGGISYQWSGPNGFSSTQPNTSILLASFTDSGTYMVYIETDFGCKETLVFEVLVSRSPYVGTITDLFGCENDFNTGISSLFNTSQIEIEALDSQLGMTVSYFDSNGNQLPSPLSNPTSNTIPNNEAITVRVSNENNPECYAETIFNLIVQPLPEAFSIADVFACDDDSDGFSSFDLSSVESIVLGGQTGMTVEYYDGNGNQLPNPLPNPYVNSIPNQETIIARVINDATDCYNEITFNLNVNANPIANPIASIIGCDDNNDGISEYFDTFLVESVVLGGQTGMEVTYYDNSGTQLPSPLPNPFTNTEIYNQDLTVRVTNSQTGCFSETILTLETSLQPNINQPLNLYACDEGNGFGSFNTSLLESELIGNQTGLSISYMDEQGNVLPSPLPTTLHNTSAYNQTIFVRVENQLSSLCYSETSFELIINELPFIYLEPNYFICNLDPSIALSIDMSYNTYEWQFEDGNIISTTHQANIEDEGNYVLTVSRIENGIACENLFTFHLTRSILPSIQEVKYDELGNNFIEIIASGDGDFEYSIDGINYQDSNYFGNIPRGIYIAYVRDKEGCGEDFTEVSIVDYPKFFTPNNDGYNDYWQIKGLNAQLRQSSDIFIYDRYGKLLKQLASTSKGWDGTFNGKELPTNDYWFTVDLNDGRAFQGHFTLKR